jgi:hypothetical protein
MTFVPATRLIASRIIGVAIGEDKTGFIAWLH